MKPQSLKGKWNVDSSGYNRIRFRTNEQKFKDIHSAVEWFKKEFWKGCKCNLAHVEWTNNIIDEAFKDVMKDG